MTGLNLNKYLILAKNTLDTFLAYRAAFFIWRLQMFITFLVFYYLWLAIAQNQGGVGNYTLPSIITYFVIGYLLRAIVFSTRTGDLGGDIQSGSLSQLLLKPIGTIKYYFSRDLIDKLFNVFFMFFEMIFIILVFKPPLVLPNFNNLLLFLVSIVIATISFFFYSLLISFLAFWSESAWASRFLFGMVIVTLFSGQFIPLDLLPPWFVNLLSYTPYPYFYYYPIRFWLGLEPYAAVLPIILKSLFVTLLLYLLVRYAWSKGLNKFQSYGN